MIKSNAFEEPIDHTLHGSPEATIHLHNVRAGVLDSMIDRGQI